MEGVVLTKARSDGDEDMEKVAMSTEQSPRRVWLRHLCHKARSPNELFVVSRAFRQEARVMVLAVAMLTGLTQAVQATRCGTSQPLSSTTLQACIDAASQDAADRIVEVVQGQWTIDRPIHVKPGVVLRGPASYNKDQVAGDGNGVPFAVTMNITYGETDLTYLESDDWFLQPAFELDTRSAVEGITFNYPNQAAPVRPPRDHAFAPMQPFQPTLGLRAGVQVFEAVRIERNFFLNSYIAIMAVPADDTAIVRRLLIRENEFGTTLRGIVLDRCLEACTVSLNHVNLNIVDMGKAGGYLSNWLWSYAAALEIREVDGLGVSDLFAFGMNRGVELTYRQTGSQDPRVPRHLMLGNISCDRCKYGIHGDFSRITDASKWPFAITLRGGQFVANSNEARTAAPGAKDATAIRLTNLRLVSITDVDFRSSLDSAVHLTNVSQFTLGNNTVYIWDNDLDSGESAAPGLLLKGCSSGAVTANTGAGLAHGGGSPRAGTAISLEGCTGVAIRGNAFELQAGSKTVQLDNATSNCRSMGDIPNNIELGSNTTNKKWPTT